MKYTLHAGDVVRGRKLVNGGLQTIQDRKGIETQGLSRRVMLVGIEG
jgi:hypothetical protein